jgi:GNAT superfamily N-acetyltransferase
MRHDQARRSLRDRGLMGAVRAFIRRYVFGSQKFVVVRSDLAGPPVPDHVGGVVFRPATPSDLDRLDEFERYGRGSRQRRYVEEDRDWFFVACDGERIVATSRTCRALPSASRDGHGLMPRVLRLGPGEVWAGDVFCLPEYRNGGIGGQLELFGDRWLAALGYTTRFGSIELTNTIAARMHSRVGKQPVLDVSYSRLLFFERLVVRKRGAPGRFWPAPKRRFPLGRDSGPPARLAADR